MRLHIGATPEEVAGHLVDFMKVSNSAGEPGRAFQAALELNASSVYNKIEENTFEVISEGQSGDIRWKSVYRIQLTAGRPGTNIDFKLKSYKGFPKSLAKTLNSLDSRSSRASWEKTFTCYVRERSGPEIRMTMQPEALAGL